VRQAVFDTGARLSSVIPLRDLAEWPWLLRLLGALAGSLIFVLLPSATHLLGDGYLYLREFGSDVWRTGHEPLFFWLVHRLHQLGRPVWGSAEITARLYSYFSGILYLLLSLKFVHLFGRDRLERGVVLGFLLTPGFMALFCGYVESYALLMPAVLLYLVSGMKVLRDRLPLWLPAGLLGVLMPLHFILVSLAPSLIVLALSSPPQGSGRRLNRISKPLVFLSPAPILAVALLLVLGVDPLAYAKEVRGSLLLPLSSSPEFNQAYRLFSGEHVLDFLNEQFLVGPAALMVLMTLRRKLPWDAEHVFLLSAALFPLLSTFLVNPEIGAFRDWDLLAFPALPLTLWAGKGLVAQLQERSRLAHTGLMIGGAAGLHTLSWIVLNANVGAAETRFVEILENCPLSGHTRSYGWESLGAYYREQGRVTYALKAFEKAVEAHPENPRHWTAVAEQYRRLNAFPQAAAAYQQALRLDHPDRAAVWRNLGFVHAKMGKHEEGFKAFREALRRKPDDAITWYNVGKSLHALGRLDEAAVAYRGAVSLDTGLVLAYHQLAVLHLKRENWEAALEVCQKALAADSTNAMTHYYLVLLHEKRGEREKLRYHGRQFLEHWGEEGEYADHIRQSLRR